MESNKIYEIDDSSEMDVANPRVWTASEYTSDGGLVYGAMLVTFDRKKFLNLFADYPHNFTAEQIEIVKEELPYWYNFFRDRLSSEKP